VSAQRLYFRSLDRRAFRFAPRLRMSKNPPNAPRRHRGNPITPETLKRPGPKSARINLRHLCIATPLKTAKGEGPRVNKNFWSRAKLQTGCSCAPSAAVCALSEAQIQDCCAPQRFARFPRERRIAFEEAFISLTTATDPTGPTDPHVHYRHWPTTTCWTTDH